MSLVLKTCILKKKSSAATSKQTTVYFCASLLGSGVLSTLSKEVITAMRGAGLVAEPVKLRLLAQRKEFSGKVPSLLVSAACQQ